MGERKKDRQDTAQDSGTLTRHGRWTPEVSEAADRELRKLAEEDPAPAPATESVDKSHLSVPEERHPGEP